MSAAARRRNGSTRQYRRARAITLNGATVCHLCGKPFTNPADPPVADHLIPVSHGGTDHPANLRAAHASCNVRRGNRPLTTTTEPTARRGPDPTRETHPNLVFKWNAASDKLTWYSREW